MAWIRMFVLGTAELFVDIIINVIDAVNIGMFFDFRHNSVADGDELAV